MFVCKGVALLPRSQSELFDLAVEGAFADAQHFGFFALDSLIRPGFDP
jgi:hypothetical protein